MVSRNLRPCGRYLRNNAAFADAGVTNKAHIRQKFQLQLNPAVLTRLALFGKRRRTVGCRGIAGIALAAASALGYNVFLPVLNKVSQAHARSIVAHQRAHRHFNNNVIGPVPGAVAVAALPAAFGHKFTFITEINQRVQIFIRTQNNAAAASAVAAVRAALFYKFFPAEAAHAVAACACFHINSCSVNKHSKISCI